MSSLLTRVFTLLSFLFALSAHGESQLAPLKETRYLMGTMLELTIIPPKSDSGRDIIESCFKIVSDLEKLLSTYIPDSELSRFNATGHLERPTAQFMAFLDTSRALRDRSSGLFDPSIRPVVELWQSASVSNSLPTAQEIAVAKECIGHWPELNPARALIRRCPSLRIESGGIGKGYAVDLVVEHLRHHGVESALIHFGHSSSYALGNAPDGGPWKLLLRFGDDPALGTVSLRNAALSASDAFGQIIEVNGTILGHIINPKTGESVREHAQAVVVSAHASEAEAASKVVILGGIEDVMREKLAAWALHKGSGGLKVTPDTPDNEGALTVRFTSLDIAR